MSGHSKWSQIRHKKAASDRKRGQLFSKLSRLITLAAKNGINPKINLSLAQAIEKARAYNMPNGNIERAIGKASDKSSDQLKELTIEALGLGRVALKIKAITDNKNRTLAEVRLILNNHSAKMVPLGSISWMLTQPSTHTLNEFIGPQINKLIEALDENEEVEEIITNL